MLFLLPLFCQVGPGRTPVQSGLLIMPRFLSAISLKFISAVLARLGYRLCWAPSPCSRDWVIGRLAVVGKATSLGGGGRPPLS